jgi:hypothetical protein
MKTLLPLLAVFVLAVFMPSAEAGERPVCKVWLDDGGVVARTTGTNIGDYLAGRPETAGLALNTLDGWPCPANRLQTDGGIVSADGGLLLTDSSGTPTDGGYAGCPFCDFRNATSVVLQCSAPVYYSEQWDGGTDAWGQRGVVPATSNHEKIDFSVNPDGYRIDFRDGFIGNHHLSIKPVAASASNFCTISTIKRASP